MALLTYPYGRRVTRQADHDGKLRLDGLAGIGRQIPAGLQPLPCRDRAHQAGQLRRRVHARPRQRQPHLLPTINTDRKLEMPTGVRTAAPPPQPVSHTADTAYDFFD